MSPDIGLETHIQDILGVLAYEDLHDVILVGHSYSGMVVTGVAYRVPDRIAELVYLDAFVPEDGKALVDYQPPQTRELFMEKTRTEGEGYKLPALIPPEAFGITDEADLAWVRPRMDPHPFKTKLDPVRLADPRGAGIPRTFIRCTDPADPPFAQFAQRVRSDGSWRPSRGSLPICCSGWPADPRAGSPACHRRRPRSLRNPDTMVEVRRISQESGRTEWACWICSAGGRSASGARRRTAAQWPDR